jgi:sRNA-binding regulator protein Hfq
MKDGMDSTAVGRAPEPEFANRKLIRPALTRNEHPRTATTPADQQQAVERRERAERGGTMKKSTPPEQTHAENFYYQKQMQSKTPMVVVLRDGEEVHGIIEWYDKSCIKLTRPGNSNLLIYKPAIKYMYKEAEGTNK